MHEIEGWFAAEAAHNLAFLLKEYEIKTVTEVGSFVGLSTAFFAAHTNRIYAVDPFVLWPEGEEENLTAVQYGEDFYAKFLSNMAERDLLGRVVPIRMTSAEASVLPFLSSDLVYLDAAHDYESVKADIRFWTPKANKIICGDDYDQNYPGVMRAVQEAFLGHHSDGRFWWVIQ